MGSCKYCNWACKKEQVLVSVDVRSTTGANLISARRPWPILLSAVSCARSVIGRSVSILGVRSDSLVERAGK